MPIVWICSNEELIGTQCKENFQFITKIYILSVLEMLAIAVIVNDNIFTYLEWGPYQFSRKEGTEKWEIGFWLWIWKEI